MMKSAMMKDLYYEIERLKQGQHFVIIELLVLIFVFNYFTRSAFFFSEVFSAREKNGIYIPRDRYLQEESEKKVFFILQFHIP